jgi:osmotically-inducible protein OsmY
MKGQIQFLSNTQDNIALMAMSRYSDTSRIEKAKVIAYHEGKSNALAYKTTKRDRAIKAAIRRQLKKNMDISFNDIQIAVRNGWVTLNGKQNWDYQKESAKHCIKQRGIKGIINNIQVKTDRSILLSIFYESIEKD